MQTFEEQELLPDIAIECSREGIENGKEKANSLFVSGSIEESVRWYSKCISLLDAGKVAEAPGSLRSVLHSNRAIAYVKLKMWVEAEEDATKSLAANPQNRKATYWRAAARLELGRQRSAASEWLAKEILRSPTGPPRRAYLCQMGIAPLSSEGGRGFMVEWTYLDPVPEAVGGETCRLCHRPARKKCLACKNGGVVFRYCTQACQVIDWPRHRMLCPHRRGRRLNDAALSTCERRKIDPLRILWFRSAEQGVL